MSTSLDGSPWTDHEDLEFRLGQAEADLFVLRQHLRRALAESEDLQATFGHVLESLPQGLILTDPESRVRSLNRAAERMLGVSRAHARGVAYAQLWRGRRSPAERLRAGGPALEGVSLAFEAGELSLDSEVLWILGATGERAGCVEMLTDRTETRRLSRELEETRGLVAMGRMAAVAAHEIRNPLGGIAGFLDLLERGLEPGDVKCGYASRIREGVVSLERLVSEFLEFTRPAAVAREPVELGALITAALEDLEALARARGVGLEWRAPEDCRVLGSEERLKLAVANLARNALEATPAGGRVSLSLERGVVHRIQVEDQGPGVDPSLGQRIFEPFVTGKARGSGLGLALAARTAEAHGGTVYFENLKPRGARFTLELPAPVHSGTDPREIA